MTGIVVSGVTVTASVLAEALQEMAHEMEGRFPAWDDLPSPRQARARDDAEGYARALVWIAEHPERFGGAQ